MKIVLPMAGEGSRFAKVGHTFPKPLIDVEGKPMIQHVIENFSHFDADFIFLVRKEHLEKYNISDMLCSLVSGRCEIIPVENLTEGAACTVLLAKELINSGEPLLIANSDQIVHYSKENFNLLIARAGLNEDFIFTFRANNPKWSFVKLGQTMRVIEVAEKKPISDVATCGVYYWSQGQAFVRAAEEMIHRNARVNGEFYVAPVHNIAIEEGRQVFPFFVGQMWGLGTPEDLNAYLSRP